MPTGELTPIFEPGARITGYCTDVVRVGRLVSIADTIPGGSFGTENIQIKECDGTSEHPVAVAMQGGIEGEQITLMGLGTSAVLPLVAGAVDVAAGAVLVSDAQGRVTPYDAPALSGNAEDLPFIPDRVGVAIEDQATTDAVCGVWLG